MKLLQVKIARVIWPFEFADINPRGKAILPDFLRRISERFAFQVVPSAQQVRAAFEISDGPIRLREGVFLSSAGDEIAVDLEIYRNGLLADTRSTTQHADQFLHQLLEWYIEEFALPPYDVSTIKKLFFSELIVEFDKTIESGNPRLTQLLGHIKKLTSDYVDAEFQATGVQIGVDPINYPRIANFRIEREEEVSFEVNRYYSVGPFKTEDHIELLEGYEQLLP